jgi:hypothetical protein
MPNEAIPLHAVEQAATGAPELTQRLAEIKAQRDALEKQRAERLERTRLEDEIEAEALKLKNDQALECLESEHGALGKKIAAVYSPSGVIVVRKPNGILFRKWQDEAKTTAASLLAFVRPCVVYPDKALFDEWIEEHPGLLPFLGDSVCILAGARAEEARGK